MHGGAPALEFLEFHEKSCFSKFSLGLLLGFYYEVTRKLGLLLAWLRLDCIWLWLDLAWLGFGSIWFDFTKILVGLWLDFNIFACFY